MCLMWSKGGSPARTRREDNASEDALLAAARKGALGLGCGGRGRPPCPGKGGTAAGEEKGGDACVQVDISRPGRTPSLIWARQVM